MFQTYDDRNAGLRYRVNGLLRHRDEPGIFSGVRGQSSIAW